MNTVKILVVDDEILIAEDLKDILSSFGYSNIELAHDKLAALNCITTYNPDLVLLDIRMEHALDGLDIGEQLNVKYRIPFIYITAHSDIEMIKKMVITKPAAYITKPFKKADLVANINLILSNKKESVNTDIILKNGYNNYKISINTIKYIETDGNYITVVTDFKKIVLRQTLDSFLQELNNTIFLKVHRSYVVNVNKVKKYSKKEIYFDDLIIPISRSLQAEAETIFANAHK